ncbi:MAG: hypothetical protein QXG39_00095 [Candidatus Aenigmatarchaeota archaeon]
MKRRFVELMKLKNFKTYSQLLQYLVEKEFDIITQPQQHRLENLERRIEELANRLAFLEAKIYGE